VQDGLADAAAEAEQILQEYTVRRTLKKRKPRTEELPAHLPRYEVLAEVPQAQQHCAQHGPRQVVGYDLTETLEFVRPKLRVRVTKYPKFVCQDQPQCA
jgi:transposase